MDLAVDNPLDHRVLVATQYLFGQYKINLRVVSTKSIEWAIDHISVKSIRRTLCLTSIIALQINPRKKSCTQKYFIIGAAAAITAAAIINASVTFMVLFAAISIGYFIVNPINIYISIRGFKGGRAPTRITQGENVVDTNPLLWIVLAATVIAPVFFSWLVPSYLGPVCLINLTIGNLSYLIIYVASCLRLKKYRYVPYALTMPVYWALMSFACWRGFIQLIKNPYHWDKTKHGVS